MNTDEVQNKTSAILSSYGVKKAALFGSYARNSQRQTSDVDILVELGRSLSLLDYVGLKLELEDALKKKVDLVQYKKIKPSLRAFILKDASVFFTS